LRWAWIPAAAALAIVAVLTSISDRDKAPSDGIPQPSESVVSAPEAGSQPGENAVRYVFTLQAGDAKEVCLAGDFNQWRVCEAPLERVAEDTWSISLKLPPGRHQYMFVVDGRWVTDPNAAAHVNDGFGNQNAVVII
jgi:1,4-alpha-glucan branching enzyme